MLKIKAWVIMEHYGSFKKQKNRQMVFASRNFKDIVKFLEDRERLFDDNNCHHKRTKCGIMAHQNDNWWTYRFYEIKIMC